MGSTGPTGLAAQGPSARARTETALVVVPPSSAAIAFAPLTPWDTSIPPLFNGSTRLTAQEAGIYLIEGQVLLISDAAFVGVLSVRLNGVPTISLVSDRKEGTTFTLAVSTTWSMASGEFVELFLDVAGPAAVTIAKSSEASAAFMMTKIAP